MSSNQRPQNPVHAADRIASRTELPGVMSETKMFARKKRGPTDKRNSPQNHNDATGSLNPITRLNFLPNNTAELPAEAQSHSAHYAQCALKMQVPSGLLTTLTIGVFNNELAAPIARSALVIASAERRAVFEERPP